MDLHPSRVLWQLLITVVAICQTTAVELACRAKANIMTQGIQPPTFMNVLEVLTTWPSIDFEWGGVKRWRTLWLPSVITGKDKFTTGITIMLICVQMRGTS